MAARAGNRRRGIQFALPVFAAIALCAVLNSWVMKHPARLDLTDTGVYTVSGETTQVLQALSLPVRITYFYDTRSRAMQDARFLLEQYAALSSAIALETHDPMLVPSVAEQFGVQFAGTTVFETEARRVVVNKPTETEFTNALIRVASPAVGRICFSDGHHESNPFSLQTHDHFEAADHGHVHSGGPIELHERHGFGMAKNALTALGFTVEKRILASGPKALEGCSILVVASPQIRFADAELAQVQAYLNGGDALLLLLEPGVESGFEAVLASAGISISHQGVVDPESHYWTDSKTPAVTDYPRHRLTRRLPMTFFPGVSALIPIRGGDATGAQVAPLLRSSDAAYLAGSPDVRSQHTLGLIARLRDSGGRLAVFGDGDFATNSFFGALGNGQLFLNVIHELNRDVSLIDIAPRHYETGRLRLSNQALKFSFVLTTLLGPAVLCLIGIWVWRRR